MQFKIIVATSRNNGIGFQQKLPWDVKEDLKHFSKTTKGNGHNAIVMGRNTWLSIGEKPLPKRDNLILSKSLFTKTNSDNHNDQLDKSAHNVKFFESINSLKKWCREKNYTEIWIIGGENVYKQFINDTDTTEIMITNLDQDFLCDTYFPNIDSNWVLESTTILDTTQMFNVSIERYRRI